MTRIHEQDLGILPRAKYCGGKNTSSSSVCHWHYLCSGCRRWPVCIHDRMYLLVATLFFLQPDFLYLKTQLIWLPSRSWYVIIIRVDWYSSQTTAHYLYAYMGYKINAFVGSFTLSPRKSVSCCLQCIFLFRRPLTLSLNTESAFQLRFARFGVVCITCWCS